MKARVEQLYNDLSPRHISCFDNNGDTSDRYTVIFSKKRNHSAHRSLGKEIQFCKLPDDLQNAVIEGYNRMWDISKKDYDEYFYKVLDDFVNFELIPEHPELKRFRPQFDHILKNNHSLIKNQ